MLGSEPQTASCDERSSTYSHLTLHIGLRTDTVVYIRLAGELDIECAADVRQELLGLLAGGRCHLYLDLSGLRFCDSSGLGVFLSTREDALRLGGSFRLDGVCGQPLRLLRTTGAEPFLTGPGADAEVGVTVRQQTG